MRKQQLVFYTIVIAQFCGTSLWFAGNAVLGQLQAEYGWPDTSLGYLTSSTLLGFIAGTLAFAVVGLVDRYSPSKIFFYSSLLAAATNLLALIDLSSFALVFSSRFLAGFFLAGIYPVGMKIAADWNQQGLGHWLGSLVGALVVGTAFPHVLKIFPQFVDAKILLTSISVLAVAGAILLLVLVPDGPFRKKGTAFSFASLKTIFVLPQLKSPAFGYFGHMWELYALWAFVPWIVANYSSDLSAPLLSFIIIAAGGLGCVAGGVASSRIGSYRVARVALISSGICCLVSPFIWNLPQEIFIAFLFFWGFMVAADSPQFSALVAQNADQQFRGSTITLVVCIGFSISIVSIQMINYLQNIIPKEYLLLFLAPGPILGVMGMQQKALGDFLFQQKS